MDALADQNLKKYRNTLSSNQRRILLAVEKETLGKEINNHEMIDVILRNLKTIRSPSEWNPHDKQDIALFHLACLRSDRTAIENFLDQGFSVNSRSNFDKEEWEEFTPLHFMVTGYESWSTDSLAERLLEKDYDFSAQDEKGRTALHLAFRLICKKPVWSLSDSRLAQNWIHNITDREFNNPTDENGLSLFHIICCGISDDLPKHLKCVQFFIDNGVDINSSVSSKDEIFPGYTAMHFAVKNLEFDTIKLLIDSGANLYETNEEDLTPLHIACDCLTLCSPLYDSDPLSDKRLKRMRIVELFLKCGADVNSEDGKGGTHLHHAFNSNRGEDEPLMQLLLSKSQMSKNYSDSNGVSYLHIASSMNVSAVKNLMENGALPLSHLNEDAPFKPGYFPLHFAVLFNKVEIVQYLLENGVNPNIKTVSEIKATPLHIACTYDESELYIFKNSVIYDNFEATLQSYQNDKVRIVELLLKHGASINEKDSFGVIPLSKACLIPKSPYFSYYKKEQEIMQQLCTGQLEMVQLLLCRGADPTLRSNDGRSILHDLVYQKPSCQRHMLAEIVVKSGADLNALDNDGFAPLHVAVKDSRVAASNATLIKLFCGNGANINGTSKNDFTPLHFAVIHDKFDSMKILAYILDHDDVDLNSQNIYGDTPLHTAIKLKIHLHIEKLLNAGADIQIKNIEGILPSDLLCGWMWEKSQDSRENISKTLILAIRHFKRLLKMNTFVTKKKFKTGSKRSLFFEPAKAAL
ncbi:hypothetical protein QAD02_004567 [Eretmocerus hayati]|uniref:Uncharacterized protein n=1 Tax=Eretmocerus hayati TaxID=131215 RepID=A0ACC2NUS5_9HYME|nr:hypothetical protein QAD02_004567 [Eretmocerus hayati]